MINTNQLSEQAKKFYAWLMSDKFEVDKKRNLSTIKAREEFEEAWTFIYKTCADRMKGFCIKRDGDIIWKEKCVRMELNAGEFKIRIGEKIKYNKK